jgi:hypothetical protein
VEVEEVQDQKKVVEEEVDPQMEVEVEVAYPKKIN